MARTFGEEAEPLSDSYLTELLHRNSFWALAAFIADGIVGGLTAHALPMTKAQFSELMIYDIAVVPNYQRKGVGRIFSIVYSGLPYLGVNFTAKPAR